MTRPTWDQRIARAGELAEAYPFASEVLGFYTAVARYQKAFYGYIAQARAKSQLHAFRDSLDTVLLLPRFPGFLNVVKESAPLALSAAAEQMAAEKEPRCEKLLCDFWQRSENGELPYAESFFARAFLQPYAEFLAERLPEPPHHGHAATCPMCESEPVVGVLREEQLGAKRSFICSLCAHEWDFLRAICPGCGEDRNEALAVFTSEQFNHVRVEACETCNTYIKTVDLTTNGLAIPVVDELATLPLTLWAQEHGYTKLQPNLMAV
ncbi:MAG: formate dehydrogenase accessory protein FdhE [Terriglobales bacterium]